MCGRYYVDESLHSEILNICNAIERDSAWIKNGDVYPSMTVPIIRRVHEKNTCDLSKWGFDNRGKLLINARAETVTEKPTFKYCMTNGRCLIPCSGFYEWNKNKEQYSFWMDDSKVLYLAGLYRNNEAVGQHVIITTAANSSMASVHQRMPLIFGEQEANAWLSDMTIAIQLLNYQPPLLNKKNTSGQIELNWD
jgi:putative SOS response-associated peptidase YedK